MSTKPTSNNWPVPQIDPDKCNGCNLCVEVCPNQVLELRNGISTVAHPQKCDYYGLCEQICPHQAIQRIFEIYISDNDEKD